MDSPRLRIAKSREARTGKHIIEAQQRVIDRTEDPKVLPSVHDRGVTMFNRLVDRLIREAGLRA